MTRRRSNRRGYGNIKQTFKSFVLHDDELHALLDDMGLEKVRKHTGRKGSNFMFCCPFHGENRPSAGILNSPDGIYGQCYSCEEKFTLPKLYGEMMDLSVSEAIDELDGIYNSVKREIHVDMDELKDQKRGIKRSKRKSGLTVLDSKLLIPYRSGKATHKYFFDRGFTKETMRNSNIGWDLGNKRVTIPVFHKDGSLAGFSGRAVLEQKNEDGSMNREYREVYGNQPKYYLYDNFEIGNVLYGSHEFPEGEKKALIVEGMFDRIWMKQIGYYNALGIIIAKMTERNGKSVQRDILLDLGVTEVYFFHDNDEPGEVGKEVAYDILKRDFKCYDVKYPKGYKDVLGDDERPPLKRGQIQQMIDNATLYGLEDLNALKKK